ncbi:Alcohol dehydrogenase 4 [Cyphellophora attinorum]|uniref:Alcohol dehydrogenase 4 n=1 Tax=Cyphellophora attinorum TaxID=1664694 RepID=A0A0N1P0C4_9EURO|nr:Alcohol dehydrogenase 4 [Phialophora attinorum]KPI42023.1 Alcohol dehydrogenase 4 [Phialophora attinorum]
MEATLNPLTGFYKPHTALKGLYYGPDAVKQHLLSCLPSEKSKAFIITGNSLATKTPLIKELESLLSSKHHAGTFSNIKEHAPIAQLDEATDKVHSDETIDTIIAVGGGSPIDSAKAISHRLHEKGGNFLTLIDIPTTLSAAECTFLAGYTKEDGVKTGIAHPNVYASYIFYDPKFGLHTPPSLFASTGIRALDHAVEMQYHPTATLMPAQWSGLMAIKELFDLLPKYQANPKDEQLITRLFLAAYSSLGFLGGNIKGGLGLSHTMGYALGSPYGIPHGITSCLTLGNVVKLKARLSSDDAARVANILPFIGGTPSGDAAKDAETVGDRINGLVKDLGFKTTLTEKGVGKDQLDTIVKRASGGLNPDPNKKADSKEEALALEVRKLVEGLY